MTLPMFLRIVFNISRKWLAELEANVVRRQSQGGGQRKLSFAKACFA